MKTLYLYLCVVIIHFYFHNLQTKNKIHSDLVCTTFYKYENSDKRKYRRNT